MENQEFEVVPVPQEFHCTKTGSAFETCLICESELVDDLPYLIEKSYRKNELLFEYAMCYKCIEQFKSELSKESNETIQNYFESRINIDIRREGILEHYGHDMKYWLDRCVISGKPANELEDYQMMALCDGKYMLFTGMPYMVSGKVLEELGGLISKKTRERLDGFRNDYLDIPTHENDLQPVIF